MKIRIPLIAIASSIILFSCGSNEAEESSQSINEEDTTLLSQTFISHTWGAVADPVENGYSLEGKLSSRDAFVLRKNASAKLEELSGYTLYTSIYEELSQTKSTLEERVETLSLSANEEYSSFSGTSSLLTKTGEETKEEQSKIQTTVALSEGILYETKTASTFTMNRSATNLESVSDYWSNESYSQALNYDLFTVDGGFVAVSTSKQASAVELKASSGESTVYANVTNTYDALYFTGTVESPVWLARSKGQIEYTYLSSDGTSVNESARITSYDLQTFVFSSNEKTETDELSSFLSTFGNYYISDVSLSLASYSPTYEGKSISSLSLNGYTSFLFSQNEDETSSYALNRKFSLEATLSSSNLYLITFTALREHTEFDGAHLTETSEYYDLIIDLSSNQKDLPLSFVEYGENTYFTTENGEASLILALSLTTSINPESGEISVNVGSVSAS